MTFIIADDVYYARKAVEKMVLEWDGNSRILASCSDGSEAAAQIERCVPDVLITDIRMPGADGLSLAALAQKRWPDMRIILVTGYAVFDYARQALSSGVCHYLLKPLKKEELFAALDDLSLALTKNAEQTSHLADIRHSAESFLLTQYLASGGTSGEVPRRNAALCADGFAVADVSAPGEKPQTLCAEVQRVFGEGVECHVDVLHPGSTLLLLYAPQKGRPDVFQTAARAGLQAMTELMRERDQRVSLGVSAPMYGSAALPLAYDQARRALCMRLAHPEQAVFAFGQMRSGEPLFTQEALRALQMQIQSGKWEEARALLEQRWKRAAGPSQLERSYQELLGICYALGRGAGDSQDAGTVQRQLWSFESQEDLWQYLRGLVGAVRETPAESGNTADELRQFLEENYYCDLSLNELAATKYYMNPNYLGRLFKAKTGKGFSRYLLEVRMRHAQELLGAGGLSIGEVASLVGYTSPSHFIQSFKKVYGDTPGSVRGDGEPQGG